MNPDWAANVQKQCAEQSVAFFFKQWGTWSETGIKRNKRANGNLLYGKVWNEEPNFFRIAQ
jgi:protein gp37